MRGLSHFSHRLRRFCQRPAIRRARFWRPPPEVQNILASVLSSHDLRNLRHSINVLANERESLRAHDIADVLAMLLPISAFSLIWGSLAAPVANLAVGLNISSQTTRIVVTGGLGLLALWASYALARYRWADRRWLFQSLLSGVLMVGAAQTNSGTDPTRLELAWIALGLLSIAAMSSRISSLYVVFNARMLEPELIAAELTRRLSWVIWRLAEVRNLEDDSASRENIASAIEYVAWQISEAYPASFLTGDKGTQAWLRIRLRGTAQSWRDLKRQLALPGSQTRQQLLSRLVSDFGQIASRRWGDLPEVELREQPRARWRQAARVARLLGIGALPAILVAGLVNSGQLPAEYSSAAITLAAAWAFTYVAFALDPQVASRLAAMRDVGASFGARNS